MGHEWLVSLRMECEQGKMKRAGNKHQDGDQEEGEVIWSKARKRKFVNYLWDRRSRPVLTIDNN